MGMPAVHTDWTVDMLDALPDDGQRYELIDGELFVSPSPNLQHQYIVLRLSARLDAYLRGRGVGRVVASPSDVRRGDRKRNRVQPDIHVTGYENGERPDYPYELSKLLFVIEVVSPSNPRYDHETKRDLYLREGVPLYWIIDPPTQTVTVWRRLDAPPEIAAERVEWWPAGASEPFVLDIPEFFADAYRD